MKTLTRYLSASLLLIIGCKAPQAASLPPQTQDNIVVVEETVPSFLDEWFVETSKEHDPYPSVCSLHTESGWLVGSGILIRPNVVLTAGHLSLIHI